MKRTLLQNSDSGAARNSDPETSGNNSPSNGTGASAAAGTSPDRTERDLNALLGLSSAIQSHRALEGLEERIIEVIFDLVDAERTAILLVGHTPDEVISVFGRDRHPDVERPVEFSRGMIDRVLRENAGVIYPGPRDDSGHGPQKHEAGLVSSALAAPMVAFQKLKGVLYLETSDPLTRFNDHDLKLFTAIGSIAAIALDLGRRQELLESENRRLREEIGIEHSMVGDSLRIREVFRFISKVASTEATVLIQGESGTGKELVARAIHDNSNRADRPFVAINCAAITDTLLETELFGHEKGSFTGALAQKKGKLELAEGGTLFLDEIGDLAPALQAKLLRVLQEREFERVGGTRSIKVDIRLITATNRNLEEAARAGTFRQDLYYRLNVVSLKMPPLRERREDIPLLAGYFAAQYGQKCKRTVTGLSPEARTCLVDYDWPGNVRELENVIERAVVLGSSEYILPEDLPEAVLESRQTDTGAIPHYHEAIIETKRQLILKAFHEANGNYTETARLLGVHPNYLHRLIRNMDLKLELRHRNSSAR